jgi:hypothetical protein
MKLGLSLALAGAVLVALPMTVEAGSISRGAKEGSAYGKRVAGPVGGAVGSVMGGAAYGFRSGASKVLGVPEETGAVKRKATPRSKRPADR